MDRSGRAGRFSTETLRRLGTSVSEGRARLILANPPGISCRKLYICYSDILMLVSPSGERFFDVVLPRTIESTLNISLPERDAASEIGRSE